MFCQGEEISSSPISFDVYDPQKAWLSGPQKGIVGEEVVFTGMTKFIVSNCIIIKWELILNYELVDGLVFDFFAW